MAGDDWHIELEALASPPSFFLATPHATLLAREPLQRIEGNAADRKALLRAVDGVLADRACGGAPVIVGALPFDARSDVALFRPTRVLSSGPWAPRLARANAAAPRRHASLSEAREQASGPFTSAVKRALGEIERHALTKVVLSRRCEIALERPPHLPALLGALCERNPFGYSYALRMSCLAAEHESERVLVGASPELLVGRFGSRVSCTPLAGSRVRSCDEAIDRARIAELMGCEKDHREHQIVVAQILEDLEPFTRELSASREPEIFRTPTMLHLGTRITGELRAPHASSLELALALHPTPAVCGVPKRDAARWIETHEPFQRGLFAGAIGYMTESGDGEWAVTIRCAELSGARAHLFAGAGIVAGSDPQLELEETAAKMGTMAAVLQEATR